MLVWTPKATRLIFGWLAGQLLDHQVVIDGGVVRLDIGAQHETIVRELRVHVTHHGIVSAMVLEVGAGGGVLAGSSLRKP